MRIQEFGRTLGLLVLAGTIFAQALQAQVWNPRRASRDTVLVRPELRIDHLGGLHRALHVGVGISARAGTYLRVGGNVGVAPDWTGGVNDRAHADLTARFMIDPFRQSRLGLSVGGGVSARYQRDRVRAFALVLADLEFGRTSGWNPFIRAGLGGGTRLAIGTRRAATFGR